MNAIDYIVLGALAIAVAGICVWLVRRKKQGKSGCGCCPNAGNCSDKSCRKWSQPQNGFQPSDN